MSRAHEEELRQAGLRFLSLFGSVARGETEMDSDINLAAEFDPVARMDLLQLTKRGGAAHRRAIWQSDGPFCLKNRKAAGGCWTAHAF